VQVGAAQCRGGQPDDGIGRFLKLRLGNVIDANITDSVKDDPGLFMRPARKRR
jgi:hypothetical protein